jgi:hypothetical protein
MVNIFHLGIIFCIARPLSDFFQVQLTIQVDGGHNIPITRAKQHQKAEYTRNVSSKKKHSKELCFSRNPQQNKTEIEFKHSAFDQVCAQVIT